MRVRSTPAAGFMLGWIAFMFTPMLALAQPDANNPFPELPPEAPIDGGLGLLALGGGAYAAKKLKHLASKKSDKMHS